MDLDLTPISNPPITSAKWYHGKFDPQNLGPWTEITERVTVEAGTPARLRLPRVGVEHMGSYKITGINSIGTTDFVFFLNVTHWMRQVVSVNVKIIRKPNALGVLIHCIMTFIGPWDRKYFKIPQSIFPFLTRSQKLPGKNFSLTKPERLSEIFSPRGRRKKETGKLD
ncbi:unnamed protein product [Rodentolepis nana]|uniref:Immunoglobulin I-set domain-containing protein n=1 Tax=Rodentolepis nana TaxID=102285 RepID=A0A3P7T322_RODNA|nr:unnamed protein product [Rodentolepis nana]